MVRKKTCSNSFVNRTALNGPCCLSNENRIMSEVLLMMWQFLGGRVDVPVSGSTIGRLCGCLENV